MKKSKSEPKQKQSSMLEKNGYKLLNHASSYQSYGIKMTPAKNLEGYYNVKVLDLVK